jgi:hypothetical protein
VRFADVARGGIRIIRSANQEVYSRNVTTLFDENYNLAHTQQLKNKDIPEGGSKGVLFCLADQTGVVFVQHVMADVVVLVLLVLTDHEVLALWCLMWLAGRVWLCKASECCF